MKWLVYIGGFIALIALGLFLFVKFYLGAVNTPIGDYEFSDMRMEQQILVADGFVLGVYAEAIPNARLLRFTYKGDLLVANPNLGKIVLLSRDANGDGQADGKKVLIDGLNGPNGMDFYEDWLYIAETDAIGRVPFDHESGVLTGDYERLVTGLSGGENHWKKTLRFGPDKMMYVTMGSSCNVCIEEDERRASMVRYAADGSGEEIFARGLRNSAGFDWSPADGHIYATDNGRDLLGDDFPPCELNRVEKGKHYGWPYANGDRIADPDFGQGASAIIDSSIPPVHEFRAHNAPLGIEFIRGSVMPEEYRGAAIVALHGSWNRTEKDGYKVVSLHWGAGGKIEERDFVSGFLNNDEVIGRPAEVTEGADGAVYIADDYAGVVYRVAYKESDVASRKPESNEPGWSYTRNPKPEPTETKIDLANFTVSDALLNEIKSNRAAADAAPPGENSFSEAGSDQAESEEAAFEVVTSGKTLDDLDTDTRDRLMGEGQVLFEQYDCQSCHAEGDASLKKLEQIGVKYNLKTLSEFLGTPNAPMPAYPLTDDEKEALSVYLMSRY